MRQRWIGDATDWKKSTEHHRLSVTAAADVHGPAFCV